MITVVRRTRAVVESLLFIVLFAMVALTFCDVIGRRIFGKPIFGAHDITEHLMAIMVFCGLPLVTAAAGHLSVDLLDRFIYSKHMAWWRFLMSMLAAAIFALVAFLFFHQSVEAVQTKEVSQGLNIPRGPLYIFMGLSCVLSAAAAALIAFTGPLRDEDGEQAKEVL